MLEYHRKRDTYFKNRLSNDTKDNIKKITNKSSRGSILLFANYGHKHLNPIIIDHNNYIGMDKVVADNSIKSSLINTFQGDTIKTMMSGVFIEGGDYSKLNDEFAEYVNMESSLVCQSGFASNLNVVDCLATKGMPIYFDEKAHASFYYGIKCSSGKMLTFRHNDMDHLKELTAKNGPGVILVDSLYSAWGTFAPLEEIYKLKIIEGHILVVDESHTLGLYGKLGKGYCNLLGIKPDFITASLSKAFSTRAGLICASDADIEFIKENGGPAIFSSVVELPDILKLRKILYTIKKAKFERIKIMQYCDYIRKELCGLYHVMKTDIPSPIICLCTEFESDIVKFQNYLQQNRIYGAVFVKPATKLPMVRLTINSSLTMADCIYIVETIKKYRMNAKL